MKNVIIAGCNGLIGNALTKFLLNQNDYIIYGFDIHKEPSIIHKNLIYHSQYIYDSKYIYEVLPHHIDEIYHLIGNPCPSKYLKNPTECITNNFFSTNAMLEVAHYYKAKIFIASSSEVYDDFYEIMSECDIGSINLLDDRVCYKESKRIEEVLALSFYKQFKTDVRIGRIFNCYGTYLSEDTRFIARIVNAIKNNSEIVIYGDGNQKRSYCYIDDTINGIMTLMTKKCRFPVNIGNPYEYYSVNEVIKIFEEVIGFTIKTKHENNIDMIGPAYRRPDITLIKSLGWEPKVNLKEGLKKILL